MSGKGILITPPENTADVDDGKSELSCEQEFSHPSFSGFHASKGDGGEAACGEREEVAGTGISR
jgi:hypothetical protein